VPLASGLLTGKLSATSQFADDDHRKFNRDGEAFDKGETFSGVPYDVGLAAVEELRALLPAKPFGAKAGLRAEAHSANPGLRAEARSANPGLRAEARSAKAGVSLAQFALRWTLMFDAVTCAIPGARTPEQARANAAAADLSPLDAETMGGVRDVYDRRIRPHVHGQW
jgi:aryl-alcohol dehydrogenase-like predicted oxidoreductase